MRLRHTKPTTSYAGQGYTDINEKKDEEYSKNAQSNRKGIFDKTKNNADQITLYAEVLCKFVNSVNQASKKKYEEVLEAQKNQKRFVTQRGAESRFRNGKSRKNFQQSQQKVVPNTQQRVLKPQKNIYSQKPNGYPTKTPKVSNPATSLKSPQPAEKPLHQPVQPPKQVNQLPKNPPKLLQQSQPLTNNPQTIIAQNMQNAFMNKNGFYDMYSAAQLQQIYMQQMLKNSYVGNPYQYIQLGYYQNYPNMENLNGNGIFNAKNLAYFSPNPTDAQTNLKSTTNPTPKPIPPTKQSTISQVPSANPSPVSSTQNISSVTKQPISKPSLTHPYSHTNIFSLKSKSYYHVAIAYNIHFQKLKEKGKFNQNDMEKMDPTFYAKKLKMQKMG